MKISAVVILSAFTSYYESYYQLWFWAMSVSSFLKYRIFTHFVRVFMRQLLLSCRFFIYLFIYGVVIFENFENILSFFFQNLMRDTLNVMPHILFSWPTSQSRYLWYCIRGGEFLLISHNSVFGFSQIAAWQNGVWHKNSCEADVCHVENFHSSTLDIHFWGRNSK